MKKQHRKDRAELEKRENQDRAELQKQRRNLQRIKEKVAKMKTTWPQKLREEEDHEIEELDAKRFHRIEKLDKDALTDNEDDQDNAANADNQDLGLRSGLESPGLDRPGRLPHQQGLSDAGLGYRDGSPQLGAPGPGLVGTLYSSGVGTKKTNQHIYMCNNKHQLLPLPYY